MKLICFRVVFPHFPTQRATHGQLKIPLEMGNRENAQNAMQFKGAGARQCRKFPVKFFLFIQNYL